MLVGSHDGGIDDEIFEVRIVRHGLEDAPPDPLAAPSTEAAEDAVPIAEYIGKIAPGGTCAHNPEHRLDEHPVIAARRPLPIGTSDDQRRHPLPRSVIQYQPIHHTHGCLLKAVLMGWTAPDPAASQCAKMALSKDHQREGTVRMQVITIGLDIAKSVFQVHGVDNAGNAVLRRTVRRDQLIPLLRDMQPCLIGMEACATAHHWARELIALGHVVKLMPPAYVKAYVKRNKNDAADAEAICEAVTRPTMRFVAVKSADAQSILVLHRARHLLVRQRTAQISAMRAHLAEYGVVAPKGRAHVRGLINCHGPLPACAR